MYGLSIDFLFGQLMGDRGGEKLSQIPQMLTGR